MQPPTGLFARPLRIVLTRCPKLWIIPRMAEIVKVIFEREGFECQMCNWAWVPRRKCRGPVKPPRRCPNPECRSVRWDREKYPLAGPPMPPAPNGGGGGGEEFAVVRSDGQRTRYQTLPLVARKAPTPVRIGNPGVADAT